MKALAIVNSGIEDIAAQEIGELTKTTPVIQEMAVVFSTKKYEELFLVCYKSQSLRKLILLLDEFKFEQLEEAGARIAQLNLHDWIAESFVVRALIKNSTLDTMEVEAKIGEFILKKNPAKVNLNNPVTTLFVFINSNQLYFGVDFSINDLANRDYKIFLTRETIKPNVAYALARKVGFNHSKIFLDPFCMAGTVPIEAALYASALSAHYYHKDKFLFTKLPKFKAFNFNGFFEKLDKKANPEIKGSITAMDSAFPSINAAKKNAKIAGVNKLITFSKMDAEWIDTKFGKNSVDCIAGCPPQPTKFNQRKIAKFYREFFHQAEYILKKDAKMALFIEKENNLIKETAKEYHLKINEETTVWQGKKEFVIVTVTAEN